MLRRSCVRSSPGLACARVSTISNSSCLGCRLVGQKRLWAALIEICADISLSRIFSSLWVYRNLILHLTIWCARQRCSTCRDRNTSSQYRDSLFGRRASRRACWTARRNMCLLPYNYDVCFPPSAMNKDSGDVPCVIAYTENSTTGATRITSRQLARVC